VIRTALAHTSPTLVLGSQDAAALPAVFDPVADVASIRKAFELGLALNRRFEIVLTGKGKRVNELPSVAFARSIRAGDGTLDGALWHTAKRAVLFATPASLALLTAFGAAGVSDLALALAGIAPFTWAPVAAVRSLRAEAIAAREVERAAATKASTADLAEIASFVEMVTTAGEPRSDAVVRSVIDSWLAISAKDQCTTPDAHAHLEALRDAIPAPSAQVEAQAQRLVDLGRLARTLASEVRIAPSHVEILEQARNAGSQAERDAVAPVLRRLFAAGQHKSLRDAVPHVVPPSLQPPALDVKLVSHGSDVT